MYKYTHTHVTHHEKTSNGQHNRIQIHDTTPWKNTTYHTTRGNNLRLHMTYVCVYLYMLLKVLHSKF
jgi:hypothetical protein